MGCDIHCYAEVNKNGIWEKVGSVFKNETYDWYKNNKTEIPSYLSEFTDEPYDGRNYDLFAMLADVRNGSGFAGCDTGDGFVPISMPKGLPDDVSNGVKERYEDWCNDGHSCSWLTLNELLSYDWYGQKTKHRGYFSLESYKKFKNGEENFGCCGDVSGQNVIKINPEEYDTMLKENAFNHFKSYYVHCEWESTYFESAEYFVKDVLPKLKELGTPDTVRLVFWFDN